MLFQQPRLVRDIITLLFPAHRAWLLILSVEWGWGEGYHNRQTCGFWQTSLFQQEPFSDVPCARFLFIRPRLLGRGNDSSKTPSEESDTVSESHSLTPGYYWIRLGSLVAPFLPAWGSSRESEAKVTGKPNKGTSLKEHHEVGHSHWLSWRKTNRSIKMTCVRRGKKGHVTLFVTFKWVCGIW